PASATASSLPSAPATRGPSRRVARTLTAWRFSRTSADLSGCAREPSAHPDRCVVGKRCDAAAELRRTSWRWLWLGRGPVPAAGRRFDRGGILRLRLCHERLDCRIHGRESTRIQLPRDFVTFPGCGWVALACGQRVPFVGFRRALFDAGAALVEHSDIELAVYDAAHRGFAEPFGRGSLVQLAADPMRVEHGEVMHGLGVALAR